MAYCKPRQEKALAWELCQREVPYFLPMVLRVTSSGGRRRKNLYPLFKSYLFFAGEDRERLEVLKTNRIVKLVEIHAAEQATFLRDITSLELGLRNASTPVELYPRLVKGAWVRVVAGPMKDAEGTILSADNKTKLLLGISLMGAGATVEIHPDLVEPCQREPATITKPSVTVVFNDRCREKHQNSG
ncbi:transcription termination/antitermination NusG family protein [Bythopirellula polymerisocia]|uniref:transcription termination/antitermination NusG family protein n=1 Tax=Bythopirellula polymerisocia TaxID=2528003 RepID=UPI0018D36AF6|nr:transcription termination/antitermination NusG family protein [Bythopirellula polymerisocia]